jgi:hypothetical protein
MRSMDGGGLVTVELGGGRGSRLPRAGGRG